MSGRCDNTSVGVIIRRGDSFAVIRRKNYPVAFAFVAGHGDGDDPATAAAKEAREEANIAVSRLEKKFEGRLENPCKREGGSHHNWHVFEAAAWSGELRAASDAKEAFWANAEELAALAERTRSFSKKLGIAADDLGRCTPALAEDPDWQKSPGLEPVWLVMLEKIGVL